MSIFWPKSLYIVIKYIKKNPPRRVPFKIYDKLESELKNMVNMKVIENINAPTSWINSIVIVIKKNNKLRICLDPRNLNKAIKSSHYPLPSFENVKSRLNGSCYFSTLDASSGFWMVPLDEESANLGTFNTPSEVIQSGWPENKNLIEKIIKPYWYFKEDLCVIDNLLFKNKSLLIPKNLRPEMLKIVHEGHMGIERCKNSIRDLIFWPNINSDIKNIVENCEVCMKYRNNNSKEPLIPHNIPQIPWFKLGTDLFHFDNKIYLLVVDYYSKFKEIAHLTSGFTSNSVIQHLKSMFARFGIPFSIVFDNGPPFSSLEFKQFMV